MGEVVRCRTATCKLSATAPSANCQDYPLGGKGSRCGRLTTLPPSCADCLEILGASTLWPVMRQLYPPHLSCLYCCSLMCICLSHLYLLYLMCICYILSVFLYLMCICYILCVFVVSYVYLLYFYVYLLYLCVFVVLLCVFVVLCEYWYSCFRCRTAG